MALGALSVVAAAPRAAAQETGVVLYDQPYATGRSQVFEREVWDLGDTRFGARRARSVDVSPGCEATLFERRGFRGRSITVRERDNDLGNTPLGRDSVESLRVRCPEGRGRGGHPGGWRPPDDEAPLGVTIFRDRDLKGPWQAFDRDVADLGRTRIGAHTASSLWVAPGCAATLYELPGWRGRSATFRDKDNNLANTLVGEDTASSLRISCAGHR